MGSHEIEEIPGVLIQVLELKCAQAGESQRQVIFLRLGGVEKASVSDCVQRDQQGG